ncbi:DUF3857 domain-containing protein [Henriciella sp. AS95]|uniref:DUF3857 domain-containing protein n=1 Tax=Henriciella sp. AS95 TaxID=3135782 RepID=UPI00317B58C9
MRHIFLAAVIVAISLFSSAKAQGIDDFLTTGPSADWVKQLERPEQDLEKSGEREVNYILVDRQSRYSQASTERYVRYVEQLLTPNAVEANSTITVNFDPAYQTVSFHHLTRVRDGESANILDPSLFDLYRVETDREKLIYNGSLQLSYLIPDVRVDDILDYSYSVSGKNPAIGPHFVGGFQHRYGVPVQHLHQRLLIPAGTELNIEPFGAVQTPMISQVGDQTEYSWDIRDLPALSIDSNLPPSHPGFPSTLFSTFDSWNAVGAYFAPFYDVSTLNSEKVRKIASTIRSEHQSPQNRLRAALDFVQREIRYLGIELGQGGYIPRQPDEVLRNRFGDCKDMTLLLIAILAELEIEAVPFLVNLEKTDAVDAFIPSYGVFDHIIVSASINDKTYYLDPTRGVQLGDLEHLQQGDFGKGVVVALDSPGMVSAPVPVPEFWKEIVDTYDIVAEPGAITLSSVSTYYMGQADGMLAWYNREGAAAAEKSFLNFFQNAFPQITQLTPLKLEVDDIGGSISIIGSYRIPDAWEDGDIPEMQTFYAQAHDVLQDMPSFVGATRTMPYKLPHPVRSKQTLRFILDSTWDIENNIRLIDQPAFRSLTIERFENNIYAKEVSYQSKSNEISAKDFRKSMASIQEAREQVGVSLTINNAIEGNALINWLAEIEDIEKKIRIWHISAVFLSLIVALALSKRDVEWMPKQVFHPVSATKFVIMSTVTLGIYPIFWSYKNWRWVRDIDSQDISPGWRAFFMIFTNLDLFKRMAEKSDNSTRFGTIGVFLAIVILVGAICDRVYERQPDAPEWLSLLGMACMIAWIPVVRHVNKLNEECPDCIRHNSKFGWPALGMLALFSPIFGLIVFSYL